MFDKSEHKLKKIESVTENVIAKVQLFLGCSDFKSLFCLYIHKAIFFIPSDESHTTYRFNTKIINSQLSYVVFRISQTFNYLLAKCHKATQYL